MIKFNLHKLKDLDLFGRKTIDEQKKMIKALESRIIILNESNDLHVTLNTVNNRVIAKAETYSKDLEKHIKDYLKIVTRANDVIDKATEIILERDELIEELHIENAVYKSIKSN